MSPSSALEAAAAAELEPALLAEAGSVAPVLLYSCINSFFSFSMVSCRDVTADVAASWMLESHCIALSW